VAFQAPLADVLIERLIRDGLSNCDELLLSADRQITQPVDPLRQAESEALLMILAGREFKEQCT